ncbi:MAG: SsrA-binding protein SmpB [Rhodospirillales bacterium]
MAGKNRKKGSPSGNVVAQNRKARHDYHIEETFEAGIVLVGTEVKSLRRGHASINEAYAGAKGGELVLFNAHIPEYEAARHFGHEPRRPRKLLMHRREIRRLIGAVQRGGMTLVPLSIYFNAWGVAKVALALARGKQSVDKREAVKEREWSRQKARLIREQG